MKIDLNDTSIFDGVENSRFVDREMNLDKPINFVFGKNGSGKSSICKLVAKQCKDSSCDAYIFQGFESVVSEERTLNAIVLGENNVKIDKQIKEYEEKINKIESEIKIEIAKISEPEKGEDNLYTQKQKLVSEVNKAKKQKEKFYTDSARDISNMNNPVLVENTRNYNKNSFSDEIETALKQPKLSDLDVEKLKETIASTKKSAIDKISFQEANFQSLQEEVKDMLKSTVEPEEIIPEIGSVEKQLFAEAGKGCHKAGDKCAFCGNIITDERLDQLNRYFSGAEIEKFRQKIDSKIREVQNYKKTLGNIVINEFSFYPEYQKSIEDLKKDFNNIALKQQNFLEHCEKSLEDKKKNLFNPIVYRTEEIPGQLKDCIKTYNDNVENNNNYTQVLENKKDEARKRLRYEKIAEIVRGSKLGVLENSLKEANGLLEEKEKEIAGVRLAISNLEESKQNSQGKIGELVAKTKSVEKLKKNINDKLKTYVNFQLNLVREDGREFYEIKETVDGKEQTRSVDHLSTGEKNIIAFLYFIESLNDAEKDHTKPKVIVFDDPMNSNDDAMQYLIVDEIRKIVKRVGGKTGSIDDKLLLLTHNILFYLNSVRLVQTEWGRDRNKNIYGEYNFYRLMACGGKTHVRKIEKSANDLKTQYESLWYELVFLYEQKKPELMCNPARRIIESYMSFTKKDDFYKDNKDAKILFNANSHDAMLDPMTDTLGKDHDDIKDVLKKCFESNGDKQHFNNYWKIGRGR